MIGLLDGWAQGTECRRHDRAGLLEGIGLGSGRSFAFQTFLGACVTEFHALRQTFLAEAGNDGNQLHTSRLCAVPFGCSLFEIAAHFADDDDCLRLRIVLEHFKIADVVGSRIGIAADPDRRRNAIGKLRADPDNLVGEAAGLGDDAE